MDSNVEKTGRPVLVMSVTWTGDLLCPSCGAPLHYAFPGVVRRVEDLREVIMLLGHYYSCSDENCKLHKPFRAPQAVVLPYKKFGRHVHEAIIRHFVELGQNATQVAASLAMDFHLQISPKTVTRYIEAYLTLQSEVATAETLAAVAAAGYLIIAIDGQRPEAGRPSLWYFTDLVTGAMLHAEYLRKADTKTLAGILRAIAGKYGVPVAGVLSDHQKSIVNAVAKCFPGARHQFCHFHFLHNVSLPLEQMDSHLQASLEQAVNSLYINTTSTQQEVAMAPGRPATVQTFFTPMQQDLRALVQNPARRFESWAGPATFEALEAYVGRVREELLPAVPRHGRPGKILQKLVSSLEEALGEARPLHDKLCFLRGRFDALRDLLGTKAYTARGMQARAREWVEELKKHLRKLGETYGPEELRVQVLTYRASVASVLKLWICLYQHHEEGLFHFLDVPGLERANVGMEREFSGEVGFFRAHYGKGKVGYHVRVTGDHVLQIRKGYNPAKVQSTFDHYSLDLVRRKGVIFQERRAIERASWRHARRDLTGLLQMKKRIKSLPHSKSFLSG